MSPRCNFSLSSGGAPNLQAVVSIALPAAQAFSASSTIHQAREHTHEHDDQPLELFHTCVRSPDTKGAKWCVASRPRESFGDARRREDDGVLSCCGERCGVATHSREWLLFGGRSASPVAVLSVVAVVMEDVVAAGVSTQRQLYQPPTPPVEATDSTFPRGQGSSPRNRSSR